MQVRKKTATQQQINNNNHIIINNNKYTQSHAHKIKGVPKTVTKMRNTDISEWLQSGEEKEPQNKSVYNPSVP